MITAKFEELLNFLEDKKRVLILTHDMVDLDGLVSSFALKHFLNKYISEIEIIVSFSELSKKTENFMEKYLSRFPEFDLNYKLEKEIDVNLIDVILILDTSELNQVKFKENEVLATHIFIDHHYHLNESEEGGNISSLNVICDEYASTAEMIFELYDGFHVELSAPVKYLIVAGILTDSGFFRFGNNKTINRVSKLLDGTPNEAFQEILLLLKYDVNTSEKIANIKGIKRVSLIREKDWLIGFSEVSSYGSSVAKRLIKIGFDIVFVISQEKKSEEYRISARATKEICFKTGLHLGKIFKDIAADDVNANGGGHDGAAGFSGNDGLDLVREKIINKIKEILN